MLLAKINPVMWPTVIKFSHLIKLKNNTLSPKTETGHLLPHWVLATKYVLQSKWTKMPLIELFETGGNSSSKV